MSTFIISFFSVNQFYLNKIKQKDFRTFGWNQDNNIVSVKAKRKERCQILQGNSWSDGFLIFQHSSQKNSSSQAIWLFQSATAWFMFFLPLIHFSLLKSNKIIYKTFIKVWSNNPQRVLIYHVNLPHDWNFVN